MQVGADIYCDSQCIIRELEHRFPSPSAMPSTETGLMWCLSRWTDGALFDLGVKIVLGSAGDQLPQDFAEDRGRLYLGSDWAAGLKKANAQLPHLAAQMRTNLSWLDTQLGDDRDFLLGAKPGAIDAQIYHVVWFLRGRWGSGPEFLSEFKSLERWEKNVEALGHGKPRELSDDDALQIAKSAEPTTASGVQPHDPQGLSVGDSIIVGPDVDGGEQGVRGRVHFANAETIAVMRDDEAVGTVCVHFPRAGYRIDIA